MGSIRSVCYWASWYMMLEKERKKKKNTPINWTHFSCTVFVLKKLVPLQSRSWVSFNKWNHVVQSTSKVYELLSLQPWNAARYLDFQHVLVLYANNVVLHGFTGYSHKLLEIQKFFFFFGSISPQTFRVDFTCLEEIAIALLHRNLSELVGIYGQAVQRNKHHCGRDGMFLHAFLVESKFLLICYLCTPLSTFHVTANPAALLVLQAVGQHVQRSA